MLQINFHFLLRKTRAVLNLKITLISQHTDPRQVVLNDCQAKEVNVTEREGLPKF